MFLSNTNNFQTYLFDRLMGHQQVLPLQVVVDMGIMVTKR